MHVDCIRIRITMSDPKHMRDVRPGRRMEALDQLRQAQGRIPRRQPIIEHYDAQTPAERASRRPSRGSVMRGRGLYGAVHRRVLHRHARHRRRHLE